MAISLICIALLALLTISLGFYVSSCRAKNNVIYAYQDKPTDPLYKAIRAHGNSCEYVPIIALLIYILGSMNPAAWMVWCMVLATVSRFLIVWGILGFASLEKPNIGRFLGAMGTYIFGTALCVALLLKVL